MFRVVKCHFGVFNLVRVAAGIASLVLLCVCATRASIVDISGAGELVTQSMMDAFVSQCPNCAGRFYVNKVTAGHEHDSRESFVLQSINEQQNVSLSSEIQTNNPPFEQVVITDPNSSIGWEKPGLTLPSQQVVNSHYIWLNAYCDGAHGCNVKHDIATFKFDGPIIGIIGGPPDLNASNGPIGLNTVGYTPTVTGFVNERCNNNPTDPANGIGPSGDVVTKLAPAVLRVDFTSISGDYVRVITAANVPFHAGDFDHDYDVDNDDYAIWRSTLGSTSDLRADVNGNGVVDAAGYVVWRQNLGYAYTFSGSGSGSGSELPQGTAVPEAGSAGLMIVGVLLSALGWQKRRGECAQPRRPAVRR